MIRAGPAQEQAERRHRESVPLQTELRVSDLPLQRQEDANGRVVSPCSGAGSAPQLIQDGGSRAFLFLEE